MENNEEIKVEETKAEPTKKKGISLFTLFACLMTAFVVVLATNIGQRIGKRIADEDRNPIVKEDKKDETSNKEETKPEETKPEETKPEETAVTYTNAKVVGNYEYDTKDATMSLELRENGLYIKSTNIKAPGCGPSTVGNYYIEGDTIVLNSITTFGCDAQGELSVGKTVGKLNGTTITFDKDVYTFKNKNLVHGETDEKFVNSYIYETIGQGFAYKNNN